MLAQDSQCRLKDLVHMLVETAGSGAADAPAGEAGRPRPSSQGSGSSQPLAGGGPASAARLPGRERSVAAARTLLNLMLELFGGVPPCSHPPPPPQLLPGVEMAVPQQNMQWASVRLVCGAYWIAAGEGGWQTGAGSSGSR